MTREQLIRDLQSTKKIIEKHNICIGKFEDTNSICLDGALRKAVYGKIKMTLTAYCGKWDRYLSAYEAIKNSAPKVQNVVTQSPLQYLNDIVAKGDKNIIINWIEKALAEEGGM